MPALPGGVMAKLKPRGKIGTFNPTGMRPLEVFPQRYTFYSMHVRKVMDGQGIVHDTRLAAADRSYHRETCCSSTMWHRLEPIMIVEEDMVTTCLECAVARPDR